MIFHGNRILSIFTKERGSAGLASHQFPRWGGGIKDKHLGHVKFVNTCPIDNWLVILHYVCIQNSKIRKHLNDNQFLNELEQLYCKKKFDMQKLKLMEKNSIKVQKGIVDYFENEWIYFIRHMSVFFKNSRLSTCSSPYCPLPKRLSQHSGGIVWQDSNASLYEEVLSWFNDESCSSCGQTFTNHPPTDAPVYYMESTTVR
jgi:hypothetical protein